jgi:two-component system CheB/CheR fusion protein
LKKSRPKPRREKSPIAARNTGKATAFPIVGIGASAGGLAAFEAFFSGMPADRDPGMAFVIVQHLAPDHKSILSELIQRYTRMAVHEVADGMVVQPNCAYIIPPGHDMALLNGSLQLLKLTDVRGQRLPIDYFFRSLAQDQRERAIGIILSGTGSDGTLGVRAIKEENGMVIVQTPESAEFDGMPRSAIATGLVDYELPPAEMPAKLVAYAEHLVGRRPIDVIPRTEAKTSLKKIFLLLRTQTGHDFSLYKPTTINRRIERRMALHQIDRLESYVGYLLKNPNEVEALFHDLLINVTRFFRDPDAFAALEKEIIPSLFENRPDGVPVRIWVPGCSTGEEAYSIAMLLAEQMESLHRSYPVQLFATDMDNHAIAVARAGVYPASIAADVSPQRLARFFSAERDSGVFRVNKSLRDMLVFSEQDAIKDPPFSKLDLLSCRNLLIYLAPELQRKLIMLFHYALNPGGTLFLGNSENSSEAGNLFTTLDAKAKLYRRKDEAPTSRGHGRVPPLISGEMPIPRDAAHRMKPTVKTPLRELTERELLAHTALVGALVDAKGDVLYLHGRSGLYLEPAVGEPGVSNILSMAREGLRVPLAAALRKAASSSELVRAPAVRVKTNGHSVAINLSVRPLPRGKASEAPLFLVIFAEPREAPDVKASNRLASTKGQGAKLIAELQHELRAKDEYLRSANEQLQSATEELQSSNEEMQSINEELQSTNEELETSKEELQSVNEELSTVNTELQSKVLGLSQANNDMNNLLAGTGIATVFVDHQLRIMRFTPAVGAILNVILSDVGRPVAHIVTNLVGYDRMVADIREVLESLVPKEVEVRIAEGRFFTMRIQPYRTLENVIEGAVISFIDITTMINAREDLRKANELLRLAVVVRDAHDAVTVQDLEGCILAWNPAATRIYGWTEGEALAMNVADRIPEALREPERAKAEAIARGEVLPAYASQRLTKDGRTVTVEISVTALVNETGRIYGIATTEHVKQGAA